MKKGTLMNFDQSFDAKRRALLASLGLASVLVATGCGGGGGGGASPAPQEPPTGGGPVTPPVEPPAALKSWQAARPMLEAEAEGVTFTEPVLAFDGNRGGMAVWVRMQGGKGQLWSSRLQPNGVWLEPQAVDLAIAGFAANPQMVVDAAGNALVVWECSDESRTTIAANRFDATEGRWGDAFELPGNVVTSVINPGIPNAVAPSIAMDAAGNAVVVWSQASTLDGRTRILSRSFRAAGAQWSLEDREIAEPATVDSSVNPQVVLTRDGHALAVWQMRREDRQGYDLRSSRLEAGAQAWGGMMSVQAFTGPGSQEGFHLAIAPNGDAIVAWQFKDASDDETGIGARRLLAGAAQWEDTMEVLLPTSDLPGVPQLAMSGEGDALMVWDQIVDQQLKTRRVLASRFVSQDGQPKAWTTPEHLERLRGGSSDNARIAAADAAGNAVVVWDYEDPSGRVSVLGGNFRAAENLWSTTGTFLEPEDAGGTSVASRVAMRSDGTAMAMWPQVKRAGGGLGGVVGVLWTAEFK